MQPTSGQNWVLEQCPVSFLKQEALGRLAGSDDIATDCVMMWSNSKHWWSNGSNMCTVAPKCLLEHYLPVGPAEDLKVRHTCSKDKESLSSSKVSLENQDVLLAPVDFAGLHLISAGIQEKMETFGHLLTTNLVLLLPRRSWYLITWRTQSATD